LASALGRSFDTKQFMANVTEIRKGMAIRQGGDVVVVLEVTHRTPGNLRAFVQISMRSLKTGKTSELRFASGEKIEVVPMMTTKMEFSYKDGQDFVFTNPENYETVTLTPELVGDCKNFLVENGGVTMVFVEDKAVSVELPSSVLLTIAEAPEGVRGDSANNMQKTATLETGVSIQVPLFIKTGEKIKVDTRTGKYMERA
jgi:elongation factor P